MTSHTASIRIDRPAEEAFAFVSDPHNLDRWTFGTWHIDVDATGLVHGKSIKDGASILVRIAAHPEQLLVDYLVGTEPQALLPRIFIRIARGEAFGAPPQTCLLLMTGLRATGMDDERWASLSAMHMVEVDLIKAAVETGYDHRTEG